MNPSFYLPPCLAAGFCLAASAAFVYIGLRNRLSRANLAFGVACCLVSLYFLASVGAYGATEPAVFAWWHRHRVAVAILCLIALTWFFRFYNRDRSTPVLPWGITAALAGLFLANALALVSIASRALAGLERRPIAGTTIEIAVPLRAIHPAAWLLYAAFAVLAVSALAGGLRQWRRGRRREPLALGVTMAILAPLLVLDGVAHRAKLVLPNVVEYGFLGVVAVMSRRLLSRAAEAERAQRALREENTRFQAIFENSYQFAVLLDAEGSVSDANQAALELAGALDAESLRGKPAAQSPWVPLEARPALERTLALGAHANAARITARHVDPQRRRRDIDLSIRPALGSDGQLRGFVIEGRDISQQMEIERELARALLNARSDSRLASAFLNAMPRQLEVLIEPIRRAAAALLEDEALDPAYRRPLESVIESAGLLSEVVSSVNELALLEQDRINFNLAPAPPAPAAEKVYGYAKRLIAHSNKDLSLSLRQPSSPLPPVAADPERLQQILEILVDNAVKFTRQGSIEIGFAASESGTVEFYVADTGVGVPPELRQAIFEPFRQADTRLSRSSGGLGLGLAIALRLAEKMGGAIALESPPRGESSGARFSLRLPAARPGRGAPAYEALNSKGDSGPESPHAVLLAQDDASRLSFLRQLLKIRGWQAEIVPNLDQARGALERSRSGIAVVVIDLAPETCLEALQALRDWESRGSSPRGLRLIALVEDPKAATAIRFSSRCDACLAKSADSLSLLNAVEQLRLETETPV